MRCPRIEVRLDAVRHNTRTLVDRLAHRGVGVCGVTKATLGAPEVAHVLLAAGATSLGESRIENVERLRRAGITGEILLVRSPMPSEAARVVASADVSLNSEVEVIGRLSSAAVARGRRHGVVLMVELGDLREGLMPDELHPAVAEVLRMPGVVLRGVGANLGCQSGVAPDASNMAKLSALVASVERVFGLHLDIVSGGNSANLGWALTPDVEVGRVNQLRLGESILLGREPIDRTPIEGLRTDAFHVVGEVIESKVKPSRPWGTIGQTALGTPPARTQHARSGRRVIVALGCQDVDPDGLVPPAGLHIVGASSDHLVLDAGDVAFDVGSEVRFGVNYSALLRAMTSPYVTRDFGRPRARVLGPFPRPVRRGEGVQLLT